MAIDVPHEAMLIGEERAAPPPARARIGPRILAGTGLLLLSLIALAGSALLHLATPLGREAARDAMEAHLSSRIRGTVYVGELTHLDLATMAMKDFRIYTPDGELVIRAERMGGMFDWSELFEHRVVQLAPCYFDRAEVWLTPRGPQGQVSLVDAMEVPDGTWMIPLELNDIELIDSVMHVSLPGKPPVTMRDVDGLADLHVGHRFTWRMDESRGHADLGPIEAGFRHMRGRLTSDNAHPLIVAMLLDAEIAEPGARLDYHVPALAGEQGEPHFGIDLSVDLGVSDDRDDCAEDDEEHCPAARREEERMAEERERRAPSREHAQERESERERDHD